jgi:site-specific recombinase XerD
MRIRDDITIDGYKGFVFTAKTGYPYTHESIVRATKLIVKRTNEWEAERAKRENRKSVAVRSHTPHVWRHTFATRLVEKEVPYESLRLLMGHSSIKTSIDVYTHIKEQNYKRLISDVSGMLDIH